MNWTKFYGFGYRLNRFVRKLETTPVQPQSQLVTLLPPTSPTTPDRITLPRPQSAMPVTQIRFDQGGSSVEKMWKNVDIHRMICSISQPTHSLTSSVHSLWDPSFSSTWQVEALSDTCKGTRGSFQCLIPLQVGTFFPDSLCSSKIAYGSSLLSLHHWNAGHNGEVFLLNVDMFPFSLAYFRLHCVVLQSN